MSVIPAERRASFRTPFGARRPRPAVAATARPRDTLLFAWVLARGECLFARGARDRRRRRWACAHPRAASDDRRRTGLARGDHGEKPCFDDAGRAHEAT